MCTHPIRFDFIFSASTSADTATTTTQGIAYSPGPQVGPSSYVAPTGVTGEPVSPTNTGPVGGAINSAHRQRSPLDGKVVVGSLSLVGVVVGGAWLAVGL